jgi:hypothetical protein
MTDLTKLSDEEKSVILARLCGAGGVAPIALNLYDPANMALAWRVLSWAQENKLCSLHTLIWTHNCLSASMPPAVAQRGWLDKVLELAIEAGMVAP